MSAQSDLIVDGKRIALDDDGHLVASSDWSEAVGRALAERAGLRLDDRHWWLIRFVRDHHARYGMPPLMRVVIRAMREQTDQADASSRTLYRMFPEGPIREACRYAGLPRPESCI
ncbi:TusE/DsrC/DsvC family sulfur relay protein [Wenzhouxiangella sp. XN79A]|uniref:TusE/DsrC/DsvC family sulfur relay protein n=1 Tax=Wenzhouxiangella sp. XN79A TaxID=2724193 RepID=UPI00144A55AD|nr:TusE/DsrC/DsvC family sulfur relay protein [Wenzhouxiangella sp. XN79A]NKI35933.1 TusE/DsrC/DsvC family sulfur relay protein [Wenzhouxiangella sp. XN79A]